MKFIIKILHSILKIKWKVTKPVTVGVRILLIQNNKVLLVKHTYDKAWYLPGGGVKKGESYKEAICRELKEEIGVELNNIELFGVYNNFYENKSDNIIVFKSDNFKIKNKNSIEIEKIKFCEINNNLTELSPGTKRRLKEYLEDEIPYFGMW